MQQVGDDRVLVQGAIGRAPPTTYKVSATYADGFRGGEMWTVYGAERRSQGAPNRRTCHWRARGRTLKVLGLPDFTETSVEVIGAETHCGAAPRTEREYREVQLKVAARHPCPRGYCRAVQGIRWRCARGTPGAHGLRRWPAAALPRRPFVFVFVAEDATSQSA